MIQLLMQPYGHRLLEVIRHKAWQELQELQSACRDMRHHRILCNVYHQRPQELNAHMRTCHASLVGHVFSKAAQISKAQASLSPCKFCQREFKTTHMRPVLTQSALLLVNL